MVLRIGITSLESLYVHAENTGSASNIENDLVLEDVTVLVDSVAVGSCANIIFLLGRRKSVRDNNNNDNNSEKAILTSISS